MLTAETITDDEIREVRDQARRNYAAYGLDCSLTVFRTACNALSACAMRSDARGQIAALLNARQAVKP